jgi:hypothetical protein
MLYIATKPYLLNPTFQSMEWDHKYLLFNTKILNDNPNQINKTLIISSSSVADSSSTIYTEKSFNQFQCSKSFTARYRLNQFKIIRKAIKHSQKVTILINENKLLYIECMFESDDQNVSSEIAFYISAQIEDYLEDNEDIIEDDSSNSSNSIINEINNQINNQINQNNNSNTQLNMQSNSNVNSNLNSNENIIIMNGNLESLTQTLLLSSENEFIALENALIEAETTLTKAEDAITKAEAALKKAELTTYELLLPSEPELEEREVNFWLQPY